LCLAGSAHADHRAAESATLGAMTFNLTSAEIERYSHEAAAGSGEAARKLAQYFGYEKYDKKSELYWLVVGAENGDAVCQYSLWFNTRKATDPLEQQRSIYWLKKAAAQGDERAGFELHRCVQADTSAPVAGSNCFGPNAE